MTEYIMVQLNDCFERRSNEGYGLAHGRAYVSFKQLIFIFFDDNGMAMACVANGIIVIIITITEGTIGTG
jgi:hypothetical protein